MNTRLERRVALNLQKYNNIGILLLEELEIRPP